MASWHSSWLKLAKDGYGNMLRSFGILQIFQMCRANMPLLRKVGFGRLIIADGMPRSGSTLIFNILRLVLRSKPHLRLSSGWIGDIGSLQSGNTYLIKIHGADWIKVARANSIIYSYRDVRDALASNYLRFGVEPTSQIASEWIHHHKKAERYADMLIRYETMMNDPAGTVEKIAASFQARVNPTLLLTRIGQSRDAKSGPKAYDRTTLFHTDHATRMPAGEWRKLLNPRTIRDIHREFEWWFAENGYPVE